MKKKVLSIVTLLLAGGIMLVSCSKDEEAPVITLTGGTSVNHILNTPWTDPGYTANDNKDGDVTKNVIVTGSVDKDNAGTYTLTYKVSDEAGNEATATRTVKVYNEADTRAGNYSVSGTYDGQPDNIYTAETITASTTTNNKIIFAKFAAYQDATVYANISGSNITIPKQTYMCGKDQYRTNRDFESTSGQVLSATQLKIAGKITLTGTTTSVLFDYTFNKN